MQLGEERFDTSGTALQHRQTEAFKVPALRVQTLEPLQTL